MVDLLFIFSQYGLLKSTAQYLSLLDIFNLALASKSFHALILDSTPVFDQLKRVALCDGRGLKQRQGFCGFYEPRPGMWQWGKNGRRPHHDEEIEVRLWNLKCDECSALPCVKCGINVCEVCFTIRHSWIIS